MDIELKDYIVVYFKLKYSPQNKYVVVDIIASIITLIYL